VEEVAGSLNAKESQRRALPLLHEGIRGSKDK
jgi:hypothetical protein